MPSIYSFGAISLALFIIGFLLCFVSMLLNKKRNPVRSHWFLPIGYFSFVLSIGFFALVLSIFLGERFKWF